MITLFAANRLITTALVNNLLPNPKNIIYYFKFALIVLRVIIMSKKTRKIDDPKAYKESSIQDTMEDLENTAKASLDQLALIF